MSSKTADAVPIARDTNLTITEIYKSVQGESTWAGLPCIFVRLTGCNLRCVWCDTEYAFYGGKKMSVGEVVDACDALDCKLVEITGGEPLLQKHCGTLGQCLLEAGYTVLCETSGALPIDRLPSDVIKIMDLKCPGSGELEKNDWSNIDKLSARDEVKFVIADRADYEWARDIVRKYDLASRCNQVLFSPVFGPVEPKSLVEWILEDKLPVRFQLQMHKFIWPPDAKGV
ncbi:MAG TPA: radical SAM protein [Candidatus Hydrogenedentes bacterium]|nr:radical SAM protein [Candidatus Hydrogenedentota bacterium]HRK34179.1 radical SAM protein [Candidatus Hydrogenedentota bacterium]